MPSYDDICDISCPACRTNIGMFGTVKARATAKYSVIIMDTGGSFSVDQSGVAYTMVRSFHCATCGEWFSDEDQTTLRVFFSD